MRVSGRVQHKPAPQPGSPATGKPSGKPSGKPARSPPVPAPIRVAAAPLASPGPAHTRGRHTAPCSRKAVDRMPTFGNTLISATALGATMQSYSRPPQALVSTWAHSLQRPIVPACSPQQLKVSARGGVQRVEAVQHDLRLEHGRVRALGPVQRDGAAHLGKGGGRGWGSK